MDIDNDLVVEFVMFFLNMVWWIFIFSLCLSVLKYFAVDKPQEQERIKEFYEKVDEIVHRVSVEKHGDIYYWYDNDDGEFLGQGRSDQELIDHVKRRYPNHLFLFTDNQYIKAPDWQFKKYTVQEHG